MVGQPFLPAQMNFRSARKPAALMPPSPSSVTIVPACRGGALLEA